MLWETGRTGLQVGIFRRKSREPNFLHLLIARKALKSLAEMSAPRDQQQPSTEMYA